MSKKRSKQSTYESGVNQDLHSIENLDENLNPNADDNWNNLGGVLNDDFNQAIDEYFSDLETISVTDEDMDVDLNNENLNENDLINGNLTNSSNNLNIDLNNGTQNSRRVGSSRKKVSRKSSGSTLPQKFIRIRNFYQLSLNSTLTISNLGDDDIKFLFSKSKDKSEDLLFCENKLIELNNNSVFDCLDNLSDNESINNEDAHLENSFEYANNGQMSNLNLVGYEDSLNSQGNLNEHQLNEDEFINNESDSEEVLDFEFKKILNEISKKFNPKAIIDSILNEN